MELENQDYPIRGMGVSITRENSKININLNDKEMVKFADSASAVRKMNLAL